MKKLLFLLTFLPIMAVGQTDLERIKVDKASWNKLIYDIHNMGVNITNTPINDTVPVIILVCDTSRQDSGFRNVTLYQDTNCDLLLHHVSDSVFADLSLKSFLGKSKPIKSWDVIYQYNYKVFWMRGYAAIIKWNENGLLNREELPNITVYLDSNKKPVKYLVWISKEVGK